MAMTRVGLRARRHALGPERRLALLALRELPVAHESHVVPVSLHLALDHLRDEGGRHGALRLRQRAKSGERLAKGLGVAESLEYERIPDQDAQSDGVF